MRGRRELNHGRKMKGKMAGKWQQLRLVWAVTKNDRIRKDKRNAIKQQAEIISGHAGFL